MALKAFPGMKFGADPELFVVDSEGNGVCPTFLEGTKENPEPVKGGALQRDGFAAEFNIDPVDCYEDWNSNFNKVIAELSRRLPSGHSLVAQPSMSMSKKVWEEAPNDARMLGCSPDFNAWSGEMNPPPMRDKSSTLCTAAGHIHAGWTEDADLSDSAHIEAGRDLVKQLDWFLGAWSLTKDKDATRRSLYGKAGAMRFKPYGIEYRVLSNFWVLNASLRRIVWDRMQYALMEMRNHYYPEITMKNGLYDFNNAVVESINSSKLDKTLSSSYRFPVVAL